MLHRTDVVLNRHFDAPAECRAPLSVPCRRRGARIAPMTLAETDLSALVDEWLDWSEAGRQTARGDGGQGAHDDPRPRAGRGGERARRRPRVPAGLLRRTGAPSRGCPAASPCSTTATSTTARSSPGSITTTTSPVGRSTRCARTAAPRSSVAPKRSASEAPQTPSVMKWNRQTIKMVVIVFPHDHRDLGLRPMDRRPRRRDDHARWRLGIRGRRPAWRGWPGRPGRLGDRER